LIRPEPGRALAYIDYSAMEFLIAGALSGDRVMLDLYNTGDPYTEFALRVSAIPPDATKEQREVIRERYKVLLLATQYGMMTETLAARLGCSTFEAHELLSQHHALFAVYWRWSDDWVAHSLDTGVMSTVFGWTCRTGITEFNERSIKNWPIQSAGSEILRIACILGHRHDVRLIAPVHDAVMIESPNNRIDADVALMRELRRRASRIVLNAEPDGPYELRTKDTIIRFPTRYTDKRGEQIWQEVLKLLDAYEKRQEGVEYALQRG
jgi:DNA polymerase I-like protein with 3'-5' exonuclease and polymerase domains